MEKFGKNGHFLKKVENLGYNSGSVFPTSDPKILLGAQKYISNRILWASTRRFRIFGALTGF